MTATPMQPGSLGFDTNSRLTATTARLFREHGYAFVLRYVPRLIAHANDLSVDEVAIIRGAGLALGIVQHFEDERGWIPSAEKGAAYGSTAAAECIRLGIARGTTVWLDLESVAANTPPSITVDYCNAWYDRVHAEGYEPGVYIGWRCGLSAHDLYWNLRSHAFFGAYNLDRTQFPVVRGLQMKQKSPGPDDVPLGVGLVIDVDVVSGDALGGVPIMDL